MNFKNLYDIILSNNSFLLTTHVNPDADAIGSEIAFAAVLKILNKKFSIVNISETPHYLKFLDAENWIASFNPELHQKIFNERDIIICLDFNRSQRLVRMENLFLQSSKMKICIDHHQDAENCFDEYFTDELACATGEILYNFLDETKIVEISKGISTALYAAIMTDTGSFRFERTTTRVHRIAAELISKGANPQSVYSQIYDQSSIGRLRLLGEALFNIELYGDENNIAVMTVSTDSLNKNNTNEEDTDGFINHLMSIQSVQVGIKFMQLKNGFKISFRSKGNIPANKIAALFGGGGHKNASGARVKDKNLFEEKEIVITTVLNYLKEKKEEWIN